MIEAHVRRRAKDRVTLRIWVTLRVRSSDGDSNSDSDSNSEIT